MASSRAGRRSQSCNVEMGDRDPRPKKLLKIFVPRKWKAEGRACVFDSARQTAAMIFSSSRAITAEPIRENDASHYKRNASCKYFLMVKACLVVIYGEVCLHRGSVNLSDRSSGLCALQHEWHLHQRWMLADYVEIKLHSVQAFEINPTEVGLQ